MVCSLSLTLAVNFGLTLHVDCCCELVALGIVAHQLDVGEARTLRSRQVNVCGTVVALTQMLLASPDQSTELARALVSGHVILTQQQLTLANSAFLPSSR